MTLKTKQDEEYGVLDLVDHLPEAVDTVVSDALSGLVVR